jgi:hypothetical protein
MDRVREDTQPSKGRVQEENKTDKGGKMTDKEDMQVKHMGDIAAVKNWREEVKGQYISFRDETKHQLTFKADIPTKETIELRGVKKIAYRWPVVENGYDRILSVTSGRLLGLLRKEKTLKDQTYEIEYHPREMLYTLSKVEE